MPELTTTDKFNIIDTPGLNDANIDTKDWVDRFNDAQNGAGPQPLALAILLFKAGNRPSKDDYVVLGVCAKAIGNLNPKNIVVIFTHCD